jgi:hypothetical protein
MLTMNEPGKKVQANLIMNVSVINPNLSVLCPTGLDIPIRFAVSLTGLSDLLGS